MMNDLRRFNLVYTAVSGDVTGSWFEKVSGDFYRKVTGKWLRKTQKKKSVTKLSGPPEPETLGKLFLAHTLY